jgi:hypothetical protein
MASQPVSIEKTRNNGWAVCIATGPSLTVEDARLCEQYREKTGLLIVGVNDAYRAADVDVLYACDPEWWDHHWDKVKDLRADLYSQSDTACEKYGRLRHITGAHKQGFSSKPDVIHYGNNSGYQAMNLAYLMGCTNLILLGYDMGIGPKGESHFFGDHPPGLRRASGYKAFITEFAAIPYRKMGLQILNASRSTYLQCFDKVPLEQALERTV